MTDAIHKLSQEVNRAVNENLEGVQDYVNITLQVSLRSFIWIIFWSFSVSLSPQVSVLCNTKDNRKAGTFGDAIDYSIQTARQAYLSRIRRFYIRVVFLKFGCWLKLWLSVSFVAALQKEYYKCGYECFSKDKNDIQRCVQRCSVPVERAGAILQNELSRFQASIDIFLLCKLHITSGHTCYIAYCAL